MANRSDFYQASIPRELKKILIMSGATRSDRKMWAEAHKHHRKVKMMKSSSSFGRKFEADTDAPESTGE